MKKTLLLILCISLVFTNLAGCGKSNDNETTTTTISSTAAVNKQPTIEEIMSFLKGHLPIGDFIIYNEETDVNNLLGRPHGYIAKVNWEDTRLEQYDPEDPAGATLEIFSNAEDCTARKEYVDSVTQSFSPSVMYMYIINDVYFLRVNKDLTPSQADEYCKILTSFLNGEVIATTTQKESKLKKETITDGELNDLLNTIAPNSEIYKINTVDSTYVDLHFDSGDTTEDIMRYVTVVSMVCKQLPNDYCFLAYTSGKPIGVSMNISVDENANLTCTTLAYSDEYESLFNQIYKLDDYLQTIDAMNQFEKKLNDIVNKK